MGSENTKPERNNHHNINVLDIVTKDPVFYKPAIYWPVHNPKKSVMSSLFGSPTEDIHRIVPEHTRTHMCAYCGKWVSRSSVYFGIADRISFYVSAPMYCQGKLCKVYQLINEGRMRMSVIRRSEQEESMSKTPSLSVIPGIPSRIRDEIELLLSSDFFIGIFEDEDIQNIFFESYTENSICLTDTLEVKIFVLCNNVYQFYRMNRPPTQLQIEQLGIFALNVLSDIFRHSHELVPFEDFCIGLAQAEYIGLKLILLWIECLKHINDGKPLNHVKVLSLMRKPVLSQPGAIKFSNDGTLRGIKLMLREVNDPDIELTLNIKIGESRVVFKFSKRELSDDSVSLQVLKNVLKSISPCFRDVKLRLPAREGVPSTSVDMDNTPLNKYVKLDEIHGVLNKQMNIELEIQDPEDRRHCSLATRLM
jgi:hypothetical protein